MHFHLVCSPEFFVVAFSRKSTRKTFRRSGELMLLKDHEFTRNPTSPPYVLHPCPFHAGISSCLGKRAMAVFKAAYGSRKPKSFACANANFVAL